VEPQQTKNEIAKRMNFWIQVGTYYQNDLPKEIVRLYALDTLEFTIEQLAAAFKVWRKDQSNVGKLPLPGHLDCILNPQRNPKDAANEAANNALMAMKKFDPYGWEPKGTALEKYPTFEDYVRTQFGDLSMAIIEKVGGPRRLRDQINATGSHETLRAQLRDLGLALYNTAEKGLLDAPPGLPSSKSEQVNSLIESTIKKLPGGSEK